MPTPRGDELERLVTSDRHMGLLSLAMWGGEEAARLFSCSAAKATGTAGALAHFPCTACICLLPHCIKEPYICTLCGLPLSCLEPCPLPSWHRHRHQGVSKAVVG